LEKGFGTSSEIQDGDPTCIYYEGYTSSEIAKILGMKESTVRSRLHHGRKAFKNGNGG
jgi:hypothetical protein